MSEWEKEKLFSLVYGFKNFPLHVQDIIHSTLNTYFPPEIYKEHLEKRKNALKVMQAYREILKDTEQSFPTTMDMKEITINKEKLKEFSIVFTAGGEGERLKNSLLKKGYKEDFLKDFTKATFPLPNLSGDVGTLHLNLRMVSILCKEIEYDIPVVVTTGPKDSITAKIIPEILKKNNNFGLKKVYIVNQEERLFLTNDEKIVIDENNSLYKPITHPDETGGPLMKLKKRGTYSQELSLLEFLEREGHTKTIVVQATALYHPSLIPLIASAMCDYDCLGIGIKRTSFPENDPYGTYVKLSKKDGTSFLLILEQDIRNDETRSIKDKTGKYFLPFNTGFYAFKNRLLIEKDLPDFATPPKEIKPDLPRAPKIGYAAIDIIRIASNAAILTIDKSMFGVLKNADDLEKLSVLARQFELDGL
ncbi:MAG: hypothetical protein N2053_04715 [Chitinispirillaceae bacterium]|nr:hypothetical protein [Chitinispirillaceae bacterium]